MISWHGVARLLSATALILQASAALPADRMKISTGPEQGIQPQMARDIARFVANAAGIDLEVVPSVGPAESLQRLLDVPGVRMALLQSDAAHAYDDAAKRGNADATRLLAPVRVVASLYREPIYFIARSDSPLGAVHDIRDAHINIGPIRSGSALTATALYRLLFDAPIPDNQVTFLDHEDALVRLISDQTVDVVVMVAEQPARLLANMKPEARRFVKLLKFDAAHATSASALRIYDATTVRAASYPNLLSEDMPALATTLYLVTYGPRRDEEEARLARFARAWCKHLPRMQAEGNPQWREVELAPGQLRPGWHYAKTAVLELARCAGGTVALPADTCSQQERVLGLCE